MAYLYVFLQFIDYFPRNWLGEYTFGAEQCFNEQIMREIMNEPMQFQRKNIMGKKVKEIMWGVIKSMNIIMKSIMKLLMRKRVIIS